MYGLSSNKERKLKKLYPYNTDEEVAKIMKLPLMLVKKIAEELGLEKEEPIKRNWTAEEIKYINTVYPYIKNEKIANALGVSKWQIEHIAYRMELRKDKGFFTSEPDENDLVEQWTKEYDDGDFRCSKGHFLTYKILKHIFPYHMILEEHPVGDLWIDILIPQLNIACEVNGVQHSEYSDFFHSSKLDFIHGQENDWKKSEMLESQNISLFVIYHDEKISINLIRQKLEEII